MDTTTLPVSIDPIQRIARFQSLAAGQYWRAQTDDPDQHTRAGEVLLIESLRRVDDAVHTVVLRVHPSRYGKPIEGKWGKLTEHRFLLKDFLAKFTFAPEAAQVRAEEVRQAQARIASVQAELINAQSDPTILAGVVAEQLHLPQIEHAASQTAHPDGEIPSQGSALPALPQVARAAQIGALTIGEVVEHGITADGVDALRNHAQREHRVATIKANWIKEKTDEIAEAVTALTPFFSEQAAAALAATEDVRTYVADLLRGIESLDLYVGKGVEVQTLRTGDSAGPDVPLTFVQKKLLMDEELAVWADVDEAFDISSQSLFAQAMRDHQGFVDQVFPTPRCVLVMATTHRHLDYGNALSDTLLNEKNREVFLLVRDGDNVYKVHSPVETHLRAARLFPTKDEHEAVFKGLDGTTTKFEDVSYTDRMADHDLFALHYRRFLILACGLDHRLGLFGKFYPGPASMAFLSLDFQSTYCRFLYDDDASVQIAGDTQRPSFFAWIDQQNAYLRSGSRVLCNWSSLVTPDTAPGLCHGENYRRRFKADVLEGPSIKIASKDGSDLCVTVQARRQSGLFQARVALNKHRSNAWDNVSEAMPYLVLDAVEPDDVRWYIHHRSSRQDQIVYIRLFKRALAFLDAERAAQASTRVALRQALTDAQLVPEPQCDSVVSAAVAAWRAAHRGRDLPSLAEGAHLTQTADGQALLDQMFSLVRKDVHPLEACETLAGQRAEAPIRLVITGKAKYVLYTQASASDRDDRGQPFAWVRRLVLDVGKRGGVRAVSSGWARLPEVTAAETTVKVWNAELEKNMVQAGQVLNAYTTPEQKAQVFGLLDAWATTCADWSRQVDAPTFNARFDHYQRTRRQMLQVTIPLGVVTSEKSAKLLCAQADLGILLGRLAPTSGDRLKVREAFARLYVREDLHRERFDGAMGHDSPWRLVLLDSGHGLTGDVLQGAAVMTVPNEAAYDPLLSSALEAYQESLTGDSSKNLLLASSLSADLTRLDAALGLLRPTDYAPTTLIKMTTHASKLPPNGLVAVVMLAPIDAVSPDEIRVLEQFAKPILGGNYSLRREIFPTRALATGAMQNIRLDPEEDQPLTFVAAHMLTDLPKAPIDGVEVFYSFDTSGQA